MISNQMGRFPQTDAQIEELDPLHQQFHRAVPAKRPARQPESVDFGHYRRRFTACQTEGHDRSGGCTRVATRDVEQGYRFGGDAADRGTRHRRHDHRSAALAVHHACAGLSRQTARAERVKRTAVSSPV